MGVGGMYHALWKNANPIQLNGVIEAQLLAGSNVDLHCSREVSEDNFLLEFSSMQEKYACFCIYSEGSAHSSCIPGQPQWPERACVCVHVCVEVQGHAFSSPSTWDVLQKYMWSWFYRHSDWEAATVEGIYWKHSTTAHTGNKVWVTSSNRWAT